MLRDLEEWLERPMIALGLAWLALLVIELAWGLSRLDAATEARRARREVAALRERLPRDD